MSTQTFAEYLINKALPPGMTVKKPMDNKYLQEVLTQVHQDHPESYPKVVAALKNIGDKFSTLDGGMSFGMAEIVTPNKEKRDEIVSRFQGLFASSKGEDQLNGHIENLQKELGVNDLHGGKDAATLMVNSALGGKKTALMKLRTSPGVVTGHDGKVVPEIFPKSYAEGIDPLHFWLGAAESRKLLAEGQVSTSAPGELSKVISNVLNSSVVSKHDCGTKQGIRLPTLDSDVLDRYLAGDAGVEKRGTLVTTDVQQRILRTGITPILVRSPQTCQAHDGTVCAMCMGLKPSNGTHYRVGDNVGLISAGMLSEPLTQMTLSAKHGARKAGQDDGLVGEKGFRKFVEMPKTFSNKKIICEVYGVVYKAQKAPQGGTIITIRPTTPVPIRYIETAKASPLMKGYFDYYIPPNLQVLKDIKLDAKTVPGQDLSTGVDNLQDISRLRNLGITRSVAAQGMADIYANTGSKMDRRHFELLARAAHNYVKIEKAPSDFPVKRGETIEYNKFQSMVARLPHQEMAPSRAINDVLTEGVLDYTVGTMISREVADDMEKAGVRSIKVSQAIEVSPVTTPLTRTVNQSSDWLAAMNHRFIKTTLTDAATDGKKSNIHGYNPVPAYAYGVEMGNGSEGRY